jgi:hypothetical protein
MSNFSYNNADKMDKEAVFAHIAKASRASVSGALRFHKEKGNTAVVALIEEGRLRARIARLQEKLAAMTKGENNGNEN